MKTRTYRLAPLALSAALALGTAACAVEDATAGGNAPGTIVEDGTTDGSTTDDGMTDGSTTDDGTSEG